jgi:hypothetical protein
MSDGCEGASKEWAHLAQSHAELYEGPYSILKTKFVQKQLLYRM